MALHPHHHDRRRDVKSKEFGLLNREDFHHRSNSF